MRKQDTWITRWCREQCQVHAGEEDHARPEWTTSRRGQDPSGGVNQNERERTGINGESTSIVWPTSDRRRLKNRTGTWHEMATELIRDWQLGVSPLSQKTPERQHSFSHAFPWLCKEEMRFLSTTPWSGSKLPLQPWFCMSSLVFLPAALCWWAKNNNYNNNNRDNVYGAVIMTKVIAKVHPVHLINTE